MAGERRWIIDETTEYYDSYRVWARDREEAVNKHRQGESYKVGSIAVSDSHIVGVEMEDSDG